MKKTSTLSRSPTLLAPTLRPSKNGLLRLQRSLPVLALALLASACPGLLPVADGGAPALDAGGGIGIGIFDAGPGWTPDPDAGLPPPVDAGSVDAGIDAGAPSPVFVDSVTPPTGSVEGGYRVRIEGEGFSPESRVFFGDVEGDQIIFISIRSFTCRVPPGLAAGPVTVKVVDPLGEGELEGAFTYFSPVTLASIVPAVGTTEGGTAVAFSGTHLNASMIVLIGGREVSSLVVAADGLSATAFTPPAANAGKADVEAIDAFGRSVLELGFSYVDDLMLESVTPVVIAHDETPVLDIRGAGFTASSQFTVGGSPSPLDNLVSSLRARTVMPAGLSGVQDIVVTEGTAQATLEDALFVLSAPTGSLLVEGVVPLTGDVQGGTTIRVLGERLDLTTDVTVGGATATFVVESDRILVVTLPPGTVGPAQIVVTTSEGTASFDGFSYVIPLTVDAVTPGVGPVEGGTAITVTGRGFAAGAIVHIGGLPATDVVVVDDTTITATTPAGAGGAVDVTITLDDDEAVLEDGFRYESALSVLGVLPSRGGISGGTFVTVNGTGFTGGISSVLFGQLPASEILVVSDNKITLRTPIGPPGITDVTVVKGAETAIATGAFTYFDPTFLVGGTRGGVIDGAVYVTALDTFTGLPIPDLVVFLGTEADSSYLALTNILGQATLSGPDVKGAQTVTVMGDGYEYATFVDVDASEITVYLQPLNLVAGPPGPGPEPPPPATIRGRVFGFAKELFDPAALAPNEIALAIVTTTARDEFSNVPNAGGENVVFQEGGEYFIANSRPGRLAVVALAGIFNLDTGSFRFRQMGVRRSVYPAFGVNLEDQDIELTVPLDETVQVSLPDAPVGEFGRATITRVLPFLRFGGEGALAYTTAIDAVRNHEILAMPDIPGELMTFIAGAYTTDGPRSLITNEGTATLVAGSDVVTGDDTNWGTTDFAGNPIVEGAIFFVEYADGSQWATEILTGVSESVIILDEKPPQDATAIAYHIGEPSYPSSEVVQDGSGSLTGGVTISPVLGLPEVLEPLENGVMGEERQLRWKAAPGQLPSMHWMYVYDPIAFTVLWTFYVDGARTKVPVPRRPLEVDALALDTTPMELPAGMLYWQHESMYVPGFEFTNFSYLDIGRRGRRSWTTDVRTFVYGGQ
jgi:hypothetical protein